MKIIVPVKSAAALADDFELRDGKSVSPDSLEWDINEWDSFSLEAALQLSEAADECEVVVISVGGDEVDDTLLMCLAMGADRAVHVEVDDRSELDALAVAHVLAAAIRPESADLVLCGVQSSDGAAGATGVALGALLGLPRIAVVRAIDYDGSGAATVERELEGGLVELLRIRLPALLTVQTGINEPRYANLRGIRQAKEKPRQTLSPVELGFSAEALTSAAGSRQTRLEAPPASEGAEILEGSSEAIAEQIATIIKKRIAA